MNQELLIAAPQRMPVRFLALALSLALGCAHKPKTAEGSIASPDSPASVDNTWVNAAKSCWPDLAKNGTTVRQIQQYLIDPTHLRSTFPSYAGLSDATIRTDLSLPISTILQPDVTRLANSATPVLTTGQAVAGTPPQGAIVQSTHGSAPPDALCSIQTGLPQGFPQ